MFSNLSCIDFSSDSEESIVIKISNNKQLLSFPSSAGATLLHAAAYHGLPLVVYYIMLVNPQPNAWCVLDNTYSSAPLYAGVQGHAEILAIMQSFNIPSSVGKHYGRLLNEAINALPEKQRNEYQQCLLSVKTTKEHLQDRLNQLFQRRRVQLTEWWHGMSIFSLSHVGGSSKTPEESSPMSPFLGKQKVQ